MGHITASSAGNFRANWRDPTGRQRAKTFATKKEARTFLAQVDLDLARGSYVDARAGKVPFRDHAALWAAGRNLELTSSERTASVLRAHLIPQWGSWPLAKIDHMSVQAWVGELGRTSAPRTVAKIVGTMSMIMRAAVRARLIPYDPCDHVELPRPASSKAYGITITREQLFTALLPAAPVEHRAMIATAAMAGLRWGECAGLRWDVVDLAVPQLQVARTLVEVNGKLETKPYPKSRAGTRTIPLSPALTSLLRSHRLRSAPNEDDMVFAVRTGSPWRRTNFRRQVWTPTLEAAGLPAAMRFHDLRHCYATWLVTRRRPDQRGSATTRP